MKNRTNTYRASLLLAALALFTTACHKPEGGRTTAKGRVVDRATGRGVPFATVNLLQTARGGNLVAPNLPQGTTTATVDADGRYSLDFEASEDVLYDLQGAAPGYLSGSLESQPTVGITGGRKNERDVPLRPEGYLRVRVLVPNPQPYTRVSIRGDRLPQYISTDAQATPIDHTVRLVQPGGESSSITIAFFPTGGSYVIARDTTITCPAHDTADFVIRF